jgi:hypothetical protein
MIPEIPQELVDATIDCLTDISDLMHCALVARSWSHRAQSHLFREISLGVGMQGGSALGLVEIPPLGTDFNNFPAFHDLLQRSPHLGGYVRTLNLGIPPLESELRPLWDYPLFSPHSWQAIEAMVIAFLPLLSCLDFLGLFPCGSGTHTFHLSPKIMDAFKGLRLQSVHLSEWRFLHPYPSLSCFESTTRLMSFRFVECHFQPPPHTSTMTPFMPSLASLELQSCSGLEMFGRYWIPEGGWYTDKMIIHMVYCPETAALESQALYHLSSFVRQSLTVIFDQSGSLFHFHNIVLNS